MRLTCPYCGERDIREFSYRGSDDHMRRPRPDDGIAAWDDHLHLRNNPAGPLDELWYHEAGCGAWLLVRRNTVTHAIEHVALAEGEQ